MYKVNWDFKCILKIMGFKIIFILVICSWILIEEIYIFVEIIEVFFVFFVLFFVIKFV